MCFSSGTGKRGVSYGTAKEYNWDGISQKTKDILIPDGVNGRYRKFPGNFLLIMDEKDLLDKHGVGSVTSDYLIDKIGGANRWGETVRQGKRFEKNLEKAQNEYYGKRDEIRKEYKMLVERGIVRPRTAIESTINTARGGGGAILNPKQGEAAQRMAIRRGYDWKTGKKLSEKQQQKLAKQYGIELKKK